MPRPARPAALLALAALVLAGCAATPPAPTPPVVSPPTSAPAPPSEPERSGPEGPAGPVGPAGIACGGPLATADGGPAVPGTSAATLHLTPDPALIGALGEAGAVALALIGTGQDCPAPIVTAAEGDPAALVLAATGAVLADAPLLVLPGDVGTVDALAPAARAIVARRLITGAAQPTGSGTASGAGVVDGLARLVAEHPDDRATLVLIAHDDPAAQAAALSHVPAGARPLVVDLRRVPSAAALSELLAPLLALDPAPALRWSATTAVATEGFTRLAEDGAGLGADLAPWMPPPPADGAEVWLADAGASAVGIVTAALAARRGATMIVVDGADLRRDAARTARIRDAARRTPDVRVVLVGAFGADAGWQLATVVDGTPLPGGGFLPLEDRRIVALYGSPDAPSLGVLGDQDLEATLARAREFAAGYVDAPDGRTVVAGLDVITTIASSAPEPTGDFSRRVPFARLRPLVDRAGEEGMAVLLDLQPGRTDFLTQAKEYEELLREPHVHLALDPEWRIGPTERHLQRIGSVEAAEVQAVADWLAALVRRERLPQKVLMLHQFTLGMLPDRSAIVVPPELVGVVHVDGQGPLATKGRTYAVLSNGAEERWAWGWKNFTRIDEPLATPSVTLDRIPVPVVVTYQ